MLKSVILVVALFAYSANAIVGGPTDSVTCSSSGITHFSGFSTVNYVEPCYQIGPKVLFQNQWIKVTWHSYMNETTLDYDWMSSKVFIEFFGDIPDLPIAVVSSDPLMCNCTLGCLTQLPTPRMQFGVDQVIESLVKLENDSVVFYMRYKKANLTMYLRKGLRTFNFGIRGPTHLLYTSSGMCNTGCTKWSTHAKLSCFSEKNLAKLRDICKLLFSDMKPDPLMTDVLTACSHDIFIWQDIVAGIDSRNNYIDRLMLNDFDSIESKYVYGSIDRNSLLQYQKVLKDIKCDDFAPSSADVDQPKLKP